MSYFTATQIDFNPRPPRGGRHRQHGRRSSGAEISIHALREEGDVHFHKIGNRLVVISIHALREEGDAVHFKIRVGRTSISIHALREEGDAEEIKQKAFPEVFQSTPSARRATPSTSKARMNMGISIHALREEGDLMASSLADRRWRFQSTPSARRATGSAGEAGYGTVNFNPRPPRGGRRMVKSGL